MVLHIVCKYHEGAREESHYRSVRNAPNKVGSHSRRANPYEWQVLCSNIVAVVD
jgi:hypothetical protein